MQGFLAQLDPQMNPFHLFLCEFMSQVLYKDSHSSYINYIENKVSRSCDKTQHFSNG